MAVYEGYGLTETTAAAAVNHDTAFKMGTVGRPLPGTDAAIAEDGEVLLRGGIVMRGYWKNEKATAEAIDADGWFHTGDIGELDSEGFLKITGRKKEILVTAGGKNVARPAWRTASGARAGQPVHRRRRPEAVHRGADHPRRGGPAGLAEAPRQGPLAQPGRPGRRPDLRSELDAAVASANTSVSHAESIRKYRVLGTDFTEENGTLTPSLKLKRNVVLKEYADEVEALYAKAPAGS